MPSRPAALAQPTAGLARSARFGTISVLCLWLGCTATRPGEQTQEASPAAPSVADASPLSDASVASLADGSISAAVAPITPESGFAVHIEASATRLCAGECVTLRAIAEHGLPIYEYTWSGADLQGPGPHRVCPATTTEVSVRVQDQSARSVEFDLPAPTARASVTLQVISAADCSEVQPDAGTAADGATPAVVEPPPSAAVRELCHAKLQVIDGWIGSSVSGVNQRAIVDVRGNLIIVADYFGTLHSADAIIAPELRAGSVLAKFDPDCRLLWIRTFGGPEANLLSLSALASDANGNLVAVGHLAGQADLGSGVLTSVRDCALIARWDAEGHTLWSRCVGSIDAESVAHDVLVDAAGDVFVTGIAAGSADFGGGRLQAVGSQVVAYLVKYAGGSGAHVWSKNLGPQCIDSQLDLSPSNTIVNLITISMPGDPTATWPRQIVEFDSLGSQLGSWRYPAPLESDHPEFEIDRASNWVALWPHDRLADDSSNRIARLEQRARGGAPGWIRSVRSSSGVWPVDLALDSHDATIVVGGFRGRLELDDQHLDGSHEVDLDLYLEKRDPTGALLRAHVMTSPVRMSPLAVAVDAQDAVFLVGIEGLEGPDVKYELFVSKLLL